MSHFRERSKHLYRKITGRRQKQPDIPPAASSGNIALEDSSATDINHIQQEQSIDSFSATSPSSQQQLPAVTSLWDRAYDALAKENQRLVKDYDELLAREEMAKSAPDETVPSPLSPVSPLPAPQGLGTRSERSRRLDIVIQNGLKRMEDNKTTFTIAGHEIVLADQIAKAANFLMLGKDLIGSAVKNSPQASIVWSGVSLILLLLTNPATADKANRDGFSYVTSRLAYYAALEPMLHRLGQNAGVDEALISEAHDHLVHLYQSILDFQISSVLRFHHSHLKTYARDTVTSRNWEQMRLNITTRENIVNGDLAQINDLAGRQELEHLNRTSEDTHATMKTMLSVATEHLAVSKEQLAAQLAAQKDAEQTRLLAEQRKCLQLFYLTSDSKGAAYDWYKGRVEPRIDGTCRWFLQHENFQTWLSQESGPLLVSADPGCGKSVLAKYLIDDQLAQQSATICYFFFKDQDQYTIRQALCALLHQLFSQKEALLQHAMDLYNKMGANLIQSEPSLWSILRNALCDAQTGPVIFVIDALDECDESQLSSLISNLERMFRDEQLAHAKFKVLMISRPYEQVVNEFYSLQDHFRQIHIPGEEEFEAISREINNVIYHRVEQLAKKHRLSDEIKSALNSKLLAIEHRTYLWVYLVFDYLDKGFSKGFKKTDDGIDAALQTLPKTVNQAYDQILSRSQDDETVETVKKALSIILAARRPLTLSEMNIAMNLDGQDRGQSIYSLKLERDKDFKSRLRALCGLFVNVHHDKIYFLHQTAREFLLQSSAPTTFSSDLHWHHSITTRHANAVIAEICMIYLDRLISTYTKTLPPDDHCGALFLYSVDHWGDHCREAEFDKGSAMVDLALKLCAPDWASHSQWASFISDRYEIHTSKLRSQPWWTRVIPGHNTRPESSANVLFASYLGLTPVTELLLDRGADIKARDDDGYTALMLAASNGQEANTRLLLEHGADVEARNNNGETALSLAVSYGHEAVTRLLLDNGADVKAKGKNGETALMIAASCGYEAVLRLLLENGADVKAKDGNGGTALMIAARNGYEAVLRLLLEKGADVKAKTNGGETVLMLAAMGGHNALLRLLLENGADVEERSNSGETALIHAATGGCEAVSRLLLENGADVEARDDDGETALMIAASCGYEAVLRLLLENGADVKARTNYGETALIHAARGGHEAVSRLLLDHGADVKVKTNNGETALMYAAGGGHEAVLRLLLDHGADVKAKTDYGETALIYAATCHESVLRLLENGADVEERDNNGLTELSHAIQTTRQLLLDHGAQVEAKDVKGSTASKPSPISYYKSVRQLLH